MMENKIAIGFQATSPYFSVRKKQNKNLPTKCHPVELERFFTRGWGEGRNLLFLKNQNVDC